MSGDYLSSIDRINLADNDRDKFEVDSTGPTASRTGHLAVSN